MVGGACGEGGGVCGAPCAGWPLALWVLSNACPKKMVKLKEYITFDNVTDQMHRNLINILSPSVKNVYQSQLVCALSSEMENHMSFVK